MNHRKIVVELYGGPRDGDKVELYELLETLVVPVVRASDLIADEDYVVDFDRVVETALYRPSGRGNRYLHDGMRIA